jgi:Polyketide cyclase / dehydrase and lipid transport
MKPITVSVVVDRPREEVFTHLDVLANHEAFTDHFLQDWTLSGPPAGVGAKARLRSRNDWMDLEVLESQAPVRTVERTVGAGGKRVTRGTYTLTEQPGGRTLVEFELVYEQGPASERMAAPLVRAMLRRANERTMERLREVLEPAAARAA